MAKKVDMNTICRAFTDDRSTKSLENLLKSGLDPDTVINDTNHDHEGLSLLQIACHDEDLDKIRLLVKYGCHVNCGVVDIFHKDRMFGRVDPNLRTLKRTCLFIAMLSSSVKVVEVLLECGADPGMKCHDEMTALMHAVDMQDMDIVKLFVRTKSCDVNAQDIYGLSALHMAAIHGRGDIAEYLLRNGARVDVKQCQEGTPLFFVSSSDALRTLIRFGADPNYTTQEDVTAMYCLLKKSRDVRCVTDLLDAGFKVTKSYLDDVVRARPSLLQTHPAVLDRMKTLSNTPVSLKLQTTSVIRKSIISNSRGVGFDFYKKIYSLPLPKLLKEYVKTLGLDVV